MKHTINIINKENNKVVKSYTLDFEYDRAADQDEINQLESVCKDLVYRKQPDFNEYDWIAVISDQEDEVGRFDKYNISR